MGCENSSQTITQGDDFKVNIEIDNIDEEGNIIDVSGWHARFQFVGTDIIRDYDDITSLELPLILSNEETMTLPLGNLKGAFKTWNSNNEITTDEKNLPFYVYPLVVKND